MHFDVQCNRHADNAEEATRGADVMSLVRQGTAGLELADASKPHYVLPGHIQKATFFFSLWHFHLL